MLRRSLRARRALPGLAAALLVGCATPPVREPAAPQPAPPVVPAVADITTKPKPPSEVAEVSDSPWPRLRRRFAMQGCDYRPEVQRWAQFYTRSPRQFAASWKSAMPFLLVVVDEIERRQLPGEFAMLPYVESSYEPVATRGDRPAGMWQLVPDTARGAGIAVGTDYDGRLDAMASTHAALDLLDRYYEQFGDWRLANMAYNSGEFRVRKLIGDRDPHTLSAQDLAGVAFNPVTHEHLDRLLALACVIDDPQRFGVHLPEPAETDRLRSVDLEAGMDLRLAARLAGVSAEDVRRWNAGYRRNRMASAPVHRLLLPASRVDRFRKAADAVPVEYWSDWREQRATSTRGIGSWAAQIGVPVAVLAMANAVGEDSTVAPSTRLLLPGRDNEPAAPAEAPRKKSARTHVIAAGDTLSGIAHRYSISLAQLRKLNPQARGTLHLGDRLRIDAN